MSNTYRIRHRFDDLCPCVAHVQIDLGQVVEWTKRHKAVLHVGQWWHIATLWRRGVAQEALRQSYQLFSEFLTRVRRVNECVRQSIVNASHSRSVGIADVSANETCVSIQLSQATSGYSRYLHGSRFECHDIESIARCVTSEFNQQVNAVLTDHVSHTARIESVDWAPLIDVGLEPFSLVVGFDHIGVAATRVSTHKYARDNSTHQVMWYCCLL